MLEIVGLLAREYKRKSTAVKTVKISSVGSFYPRIDKKFAWLILIHSEKFISDVIPNECEVTWLKISLLCCCKALACLCQYAYLIVLQWSVYEYIFLKEIIHLFEKRDYIFSLSAILSQWFLVIWLRITSEHFKMHILRPHPQSFWFSSLWLR